MSYSCLRSNLTFRSPSASSGSHRLVPFSGGNLTGTHFLNYECCTSLVVWSASTLSVITRSVLPYISAHTYQSLLALSKKRLWSIQPHFSLRYVTTVLLYGRPPIEYLNILLKNQRKRLNSSIHTST